MTEDELKLIRRVLIYANCGCDPHPAPALRCDRCKALEVVERERAKEKPAELCRCGRRTINDGHGDPAPWCCGCNQSVAVCDCIPL